MTTTSIKLGSAGSWDSLTDGWGDIESEGGKTPDYHATNEMLAQMVVDRFNAAARAAGSSQYWIPKTSEVIIDIDDIVEFDTMAEIEMAWEAVGEEWQNGEIDPIWEETE